MEHGRSFTAVLDVSAREERWRVRLPYGSEEMHIFNGRPAANLVRSIAFLISIHLFEWWETKDRERQLAKLGERLE
ncbi:hypothetical protein [Streptomyces sp. KR80]|uniref:hypothetical protein n=1 Tax=Streptomyces sp. KR80 TaxID=3457426 RepID=UPI003FD49710